MIARQFAYSESTTFPLLQREALQNMRPDDPTKFKREAEVVERRQDLELPLPAQIRAALGITNFAVMSPADGRERDDERRTPRVCFGRVAHVERILVAPPTQPRCR